MQKTPPAPVAPSGGRLLSLHRSLAAIDRQLGRLVKWLLVLVVAAMVIIVVLQVVARFLLIPIIWTSEATQNLMIWLTFVGGAAAFVQGEHIAVELVVQRLGEGLKRAVAIVAHLLMLGFFVFFVIYGWRLAILNSTASGYTLPISQFYVFLAVPFGMALATLNALTRITGILAKVPQVKADLLEAS
jgi:TRAP-type C4-dicarboxylate transport system permease small subunit